ncbi:MAG: CoA pyrophosphatase [Magnetospirillum sp. WYHS-4]
MTRDWLARRIRQTGRIRGDHDLNPGTGPMEALRPAAVLVPIVARQDGPTVLFTRRTDHLEHHPGQISFPGGHVEPGDEAPEHAALREAEEEIGLSPERVTLIGRLDLYVTRTGFEVTPVVGVVETPFALSLDPHEVAEAFEVPLSFLLDPANHRRCSRQFEGRERFFWSMPYGERHIWGATAGMLVNLYECLRED